MLGNEQYLLHVDGGGRLRRRGLGHDEGGRELFGVDVEREGLGERVESGLFDNHRLSCLVSTLRRLPRGQGRGTARRGQSRTLALLALRIPVHSTK